MAHPDLLYKTTGVPRRGVYTKDGQPVAILWSAGRAVDRERGIMFANSFKLHEMLDKIVSEMQDMDATMACELPVALVDALGEAERLLENIDKAKR